VYIRTKHRKTMTGQITSEQRFEIQRIWDALLRHALWKGVPFQDAEDLVSNSLHNALEHHDSARGTLAPYCRTILNNAIKNYWRDRRIDLPFEDEQWVQSEDGPDLVLEEKERVKSMKRTIEQLSVLLSADELAFIKMLGQVVDELGDRAVSETARRLGLKPAKGWDLFRRIQRKALALEALPSLTSRRPVSPPAAAPVSGEIKTAAKAPLPRVSVDRAMDVSASTPLGMLGPTVGQESGTLFAIAAAMAREEAFARFLKTF
jgi:DNA-directed RNA polymerase specialized sigma24 family protein